jgi:hypothetical protein
MQSAHREGGEFREMNGGQGASSRSRTKPLSIVAVSA